MTAYGRQHCDFLRGTSATNEQKLAATYYDATWVFTQIKDYQNDSTWQPCIDAALASYRDYYVRPNNGFVPGYWNFAHGLAEDCIRRQVPASCEAVIMLSMNAAYARDTTPVAETIPSTMSREVAYAIHSYLQAERIGQPRRTRLSLMVDHAIGHLNQWFITRNAPYVRPFMVGLTAHALIEVHEVTGDTRIPTLLKVAADDIWTTCWRAQAKAFTYTDRETGNLDPPDLQPAPDLNLLIAPLYRWVGDYFNDPSYHTKAQLIFEGGVAGSYLTAPKIFNQNYRWSFELMVP